MVKVVLYGIENCPYCKRARALLRLKGVSFEDIDVDQTPMMRKQMQELSGRHTVPQIFINGKAIGGYDDMAALDRTGQLDKLLQQ